MALFKKKEIDKTLKFCPECGWSLQTEKRTIKADPHTGKSLVIRVTLYCNRCISWDDIPYPRHSWSWTEEVQ